MMKLESHEDAAMKRRWKIVRLDTFTDVPGEIIAADDVTGDCCLQVGGQPQAMSFGPLAIRIVGR